MIKVKLKNGAFAKILEYRNNTIMYKSDDSTEAQRGNINDLVDPKYLPLKVKVKTEAEIKATLDINARCKDLSFLLGDDYMSKYCGMVVHPEGIRYSSRYDSIIYGIEGWQFLEDWLDFKNKNDFTPNITDIELEESLFI